MSRELQLQSNSCHRTPIETEDRSKVTLEFIFSLISGAFILTAWMLQQLDHIWLSVPLFLVAYVIGGYHKAKEGIQDLIHNRTLNVELLMILAAVGSAIIGYWIEGAILIFIFSLSGALETYTVNKSHREISALMNLQPETATILVNEQERVIPVSELAIGDHVLIKPGERIPADGQIIRGHTLIDEATLSGEPIPVEKKINDVVFAGTVNKNGLLIISVLKKSDQSLFQKIINLVQTVKDEKTPSQQFIEKFEGTYVKIVLVLVAIMMVLPYYLLGWSWTETFYRAMVLLVVASPCALIASIMPATLSAISNGARQGILFKGGTHLEKLASLKAIALDKTGTLTKGKPEVTDLILRAGMDRDYFLQVTSSIEKLSNHPLAEAIVNYGKQQGVTSFVEVEDLRDIIGFGLEAAIDGVNWKVGNRRFAGEERAVQFTTEQTRQLLKEGKTLVYVTDAEGIAGVLALQDTIRKETIDAIQSFKNQGIYTVMLTGDHEETAKAIQAMTDLDEYVANCLPEQKVNEIKRLNKRYQMSAMVGDGINDAPALATANIGIAMGGGTDAVIETSDVVLMKNDLTKIAKAIELSKRTNRIVKQNIAFSLFVIISLIISNFFGHISLPLGVIGHEGSTILVILNGLRLLRG
ncbi:heavy metal translocating P-type ATPase [Alkalihalobacillus deserti]|uniref:heavy metal translocating P-type ATPase n=1 Tax=Alkalihalobacillus deserti TaxID=2879466 RepID=UPI001D1540BE|nr:heavy metal translocating P-type ATPase [Alkalihalobacillus deserti]